MTLRFLITGLILITLVGFSTSRSWRQIVGENFFGEGTTDLTVSILQAEIDNNTNLVFSPLGYSTILAILSEGARGNTRNQLVKALHLPEDTYAVRSIYKSVLSNMQEHAVLNKPEFKNWFYVYKNYSVEASYKKVLSDNYHTIVKEIERDYYYSPSKEENGKEKEEEMNNEDSSSDTTEMSVEFPENKNENKDPINEEDTEKTVLENGPEKVMKGNKMTEDKAKENKKKASSTASKKNEMVMEEIIARSLKGEVQVEKEMLSALSANRLSSLNQTDQSKNNTEAKSDSRMIIFNALYFRGNWSVPFRTKSDKKETFYTSDTEKKQVQMVQSEGEFEYGNIPDLDATAIELPYEGDRYSLLLLIPNTRNGLKKLIESLKRDSLKEIDKHLSKHPAEICIPKFKFFSITRPKKALIKCGVTDIYNDAADLSGITGMKGLYLDDLVQLVTLEVDESSGSYNFLTTTGVFETRSVVNKLKADHPFLFFLRDRVANFIVVAGKLQDPTNSNERPA